MTNKSKIGTFLYLLLGMILYAAIKYLILSNPVVEIMAFSIDSRLVIIPAATILLVIILMLDFRFTKRN